MIKGRSMGTTKRIPVLKSEYMRIRGWMCVRVCMHARSNQKGNKINTEMYMNWIEN